MRNRFVNARNQRATRSWRRGFDVIARGLAPNDCVAGAQGPTLPRCRPIGELPP